MVRYVCNLCDTSFLDKDQCPSCGSWDIDLFNKPDENEEDLDEIPLDETAEGLDENGDDAVSEDELEEIDDPN
jgi:hypothetical protein